MGASSGMRMPSPHHERAAYRWSVSTAIYISRTHHRRGAGRALYTTLFELLRDLGYYQATAGITLPNPASVGLHEAFGFALVGVYRHIGYKLGAWHDVGWYEAEIQPLPAESGGAARRSRTLHDTPSGTDAVTQGLEFLCPTTPDELTDFVKSALARGVPRADIEAVLAQGRMDDGSDTRGTGELRRIGLSDSGPDGRVRISTRARRSCTSCCFRRCT